MSRYAPPYLVTPDTGETLAAAGGAYPTPATPWEMVPRGISIAQLFVNKKAAGFTLNLHYGRDGDPIPVLRGDVTRFGDTMRDGLWWSIEDVGVPLADCSAIIMVILNPLG